jgi:hypothetical protein
MYLDVDTMQVTNLWMSASNKKVNGLAADATSGRLYANDAARLNYWDYGNLGTAPTLIAGMYRTDGTTFTATGVDAMAFANGQLYGATSFGSTVYMRGIYSINTVSDGAPTPHCVMTPLWLDPTGVPGTSSGTISLDGLEYNPTDNLFYATQTAASANYALGIYTIDAFGTGACTKIADFPVGRTKLSGLALGGGKLWLTEYEPNAAPLPRVDIYPYDLATGTYGQTIYVPLNADTTQRTTGAAWAPGALLPEPAAFALALVAIATVARRRR